MGCYVLLKSKLIKQVRNTNCFIARQYVISKEDGFWNGTRYYLAYINHWHVDFTINNINHIYIISPKAYCYSWDSAVTPPREITEIINNLASCRFDLVYMLVNKING